MLAPNVLQENLESLEKEIVQNPNLVNQERFNGHALVHIATKAKKLGSLQTLLRNGAKVSLLDPFGETALHNAVTERWQEGIQELLQHGASPDKFSEPKSFFFNVKEVFPQTALHIAVRKGDNPSTALLLRQSSDLSLCDGLQQTILHMAAEAHSMKLLTRFLHDPSCQRMISQKDSKGNSVLHAAIQKNIIEEEQEDELENNILKIVELIIENGIDVNVTNLAGESPVYLAAQNCLPKVAKKLLKSDADLTLITNLKNSVLHAACEANSYDCLKMFLETGKVNHLITKRNEKGKDPFHIAIDSSSTQCCESLLYNGDYLGYKDSDGKTRCSLILEKIPNALELLNRVFDHHVYISQKSQDDPNFGIEFDYSAILRQHTEGLQCSLIPTLTAPQFNPLLKHPLIESFLFLKWNRLKCIYYSYVFLYFIFLIMHSYFVFYTFGPNTINWNEEYTKLKVIRTIHIILYMFLLLPGIVMVLWNTSFFKERETYLIIISTLVSAFVVFSPNIFNENPSILIEKPIASLSAFLSWGEFMLLLGKFPRFGTYISMLSNVAKSTVKVLIGFSSLLVGSALSFSILYRDQNVFSSFMHSMVKILLMMLGEYEYDAMPNSEDDAKEHKNLNMYIGSILLIFFLFIVSILMTNLFIGVAVHDIGDLLRHGRIERLYQQAQYIISYENLLKFFLKHNWGNIARVLAKVGQIPIKPKLYPNRHDHTFKSILPKPTIKDAIEIKNIKNRKEETIESNKETKIMKNLSIYYMTNRKQHKILLDRLDNLENSLKSNMQNLTKIISNLEQRFTLNEPR
ncbi:unnamed protein product [Meganyctiphanes norvegica]|uniref:Ion transport domain-containing protein n=1 Tax=Meganyctiphanes norvegica TaxID=48144 RepID=A0AAV2QME9_MEGNR